jgi:hypothetical protein
LSPAASAVAVRLAESFPEVPVMTPVEEELLLEPELEVEPEPLVEPELAVGPEPAVEPELAEDPEVVLEPELPEFADAVGTIVRVAVLTELTV